MLKEAYKIKIEFSKNIEELERVFPELLKETISENSEITVLKDNSYLISFEYEKDSDKLKGELNDLVPLLLDTFIDDLPAEFVYDILKIDKNNFVIKL